MFCRLKRSKAERACIGNRKQQRKTGRQCVCYLGVRMALERSCPTDTTSSLQRPTTQHHIGTQVIKFSQQATMVMAEKNFKRTKQCCQIQKATPSSTLLFSKKQSLKRACLSQMTEKRTAHGQLFSTLATKRRTPRGNKFTVGGEANPSHDQHNKNTTVWGAQQQKETRPTCCCSGTGPSRK